MIEYIDNINNPTLSFLYSIIKPRNINIKNKEVFSFDIKINKTNIED